MAEGRDEDCLTLNVWTPGCDGAKRPVLLWIHGGAFLFGTGASGMLDGGPLARHGDAVIVTLNYRLGAFGFLRLADITGGAIAATGDEGLLDVVAALAWLRDNIAAFGGDPANITVFGESAGAMIVGALLAAPSAKGLFHKAILQSGSTHVGYSRERAARVAAAFLEAAGIAATAPDALRAMTTAEVLGAMGHRAQGGARRRRSARHWPHAVPAGHRRDRPARTAARRRRQGLGRGRPGHGRHQHRRMDAVHRPLAGDARDDAADPVRLDRAGDSAGRPRGPGGGLFAGDAVLPVQPHPDRPGLPGSGPASPPGPRRPRRDLQLSVRLAVALRRRRAGIVPRPGDRPGLRTQATNPDFFGSGPTVERISREMGDAWTSFAREGRPTVRGRAAWPPFDAAQRAAMRFAAETRLERAPLEARRQVWDSVPDARMGSTL